jgi:hypothetical protein
MKTKSARHEKGRRMVIEVMDDQMAEIVRKMSGAERLRIADEMYSSARRMLVSYLRSEHPDWTEEQVQHEASRGISHGGVP